jgi:hypothetical protein
MEKYHRNITVQFIAGEMYGVIVGNLAYEPRSIIKHIKEKYKYNISYRKSWVVKQKVSEKRFGTYETSYDNLPQLLGIIC